MTGTQADPCEFMFIRHYHRECVCYYYLYFTGKLVTLINGLNSLSLGHTVFISDDVSLCGFEVTGIALHIQNTMSKTCHQSSTILQNREM